MKDDALMTPAKLRQIGSSKRWETPRLLLHLNPSVPLTLPCQGDWRGWEGSGIVAAEEEGSMTEIFKRSDVVFYVDTWQVIAGVALAFFLAAFIVLLNVAGRSERRRRALMPPDERAALERDDAIWAQRFGF